MIHIVTISRSIRAYTCLDTYTFEQTFFLIFLVETHDRVDCFAPNRFLNSAAIGKGLSMTYYSCEVKGKTAPKVSQHFKVSSHMERPPIPRSHFIAPLIFYYTKLRNGKSICLEWYAAIRIGPCFYVVFHCLSQLMYLTVLVPFSFTFIFFLKSSAKEFI